MFILSDVIIIAIFFI